MSKLACHCGAVVSDIAYPLSTEGEIRTQQDQERFEGRIESAIAEFLESVVAGTREQWIAAHFESGYPLDLPNSSVISDIRTRFELRFMIRVSECAECGRLYIERGPRQNEWVCFEPQSHQCEGTLKEKSAEPAGAAKRS